MKHRLLFLLLSCLTLLASRPAQASHAQGGQLTYEALGNNRYRVMLQYYHDCSGTAAEASHTLNCRVGSPVTSCASNDPRNFSATLVRGQLTLGAPYCGSLTGANVCSTTSQYLNYEVAKYTVDVTLPAAPEWTLSVEMSARPALENISGQNTLRLEATLNNQLTLPDGSQQTVQNSSPQYQTPEQDTPIPFVCWQQRTTLTFSAFDVDGDSIAYSLVAPQQGCNAPATYQPISGGSGIITDPVIPGCYVDLGNNSTTYSPTLPIFSYAVSGACPVRQGRPNFHFSPQMGSVTFTPALYYTSPVAGSRNRYSLPTKVTEYRKLNGRYYQIGSASREMLVQVIDCGNNNVPVAPRLSLVSGGSGGAAVANGDSVVVFAPNGVPSNYVYTEAELRFLDPNPGNLLTVRYTNSADPLFFDLYYDAVGPFVGPLQLIGNGTAAPVLKIRARPVYFPPGKTFYIPIRVEDNACPVKGVRNIILVIKIGGAATPTAAQAGRARVVQPAYPNPFSERVSFTLPRPRAGQGGTVLVLDPLGRVVDRLSVPAAPGPDARLSWTPAAQLPAGVYSARFADADAPAVRLMRVNP
jgi:hypothetical protein